MRFGAHVRTGGDFAGALRYAAEIGAEAVQVFAKSPQQWRGREIPEAMAAEVRTLVPELGVGPLFTHTAYLINLGSDDDALWERSTAALADELRRGELLGAEGVVTHIGTDPAGDTPRAVERIAEAVAAACSQAGEGSDRRLLLENAAGAGRIFGGSFDELGALLSALDDRELAPGLCLDTCHAHAYGYDLSSAEAWTTAMDELEAACGPGRLRLIHANDCGFPLGSRRDRHAWIGDGAIGMDGFAAMVCEPRLAESPAVMEMPGEVPVKDVENLRRLRSARDACA
jgi:deoxyribonuclease-4